MSEHWRGAEAGVDKNVRVEDSAAGEDLSSLDALVDREAEVSRGYGLVLAPEDVAKEKVALASAVAEAGGLAALAAGEWEQVRRLVLDRLSRAMAAESQRYFDMIKNSEPKVTQSNLAYSIHLEAVVNALMREVQK